MNWQGRERYEQKYAIRNSNAQNFKFAALAISHLPAWSVVNT